MYARACKLMSSHLHEGGALVAAVHCLVAVVLDEPSDGTGALLQEHRRCWRGRSEERGDEREHFLLVGIDPHDISYVSQPEKVLARTEKA